MVPFALLVRGAFFSKRTHSLMLILALQLHSILDILNNDLKGALAVGEEGVMAGTPRAGNVNVLKVEIKKLEACAKNEVPAHQDMKTEGTKLEKAEELVGGFLSARGLSECYRYLGAFRDRIRFQAMRD
jgi:hypothetical protein